MNVHQIVDEGHVIRFASIQMDHFSVAVILGIFSMVIVVLVSLFGTICTLSHMFALFIIIN